MPIRRQQLLYTLAVLLASLVAGCKAQSSQTQTQTLPPAPPVNSPAPAVTNMNAAPPSNANAASSNEGTIDACKLLTGDEIKTIQGDTLKDIKPTTRSGAFNISQCFYATSQFVNSVSLTVTQQSSDAGAENIREFWKQRFWSTGNRGKEREKEHDNKGKVSEEEEEEGAPPERVKGLGDEAYSVGNAKFGALYVLKGNKILRISVGGSRSQPERIEKMKTLAKYAVSRL